MVSWKWCFHHVFYLLLHHGSKEWICSDAEKKEHFNISTSVLSVLAPNWVAVLYHPNHRQTQSHTRGQRPERRQGHETVRKDELSDEGLYVCAARKRKRERERERERARKKSTWMCVTMCACLSGSPLTQMQSMMCACVCVSTGLRDMPLKCHKK